MRCPSAPAVEGDRRGDHRCQHCRCCPFHRVFGSPSGRGCPHRRYASVLAIQSSRGGVKMSRSTCVFEGDSLVRHVRRYAKHLARSDNNFLTVQPELQSAFQDVGDLLVVVAVERDHAPSLQEDACDHHLLADHELPSQQGIQMLKFHGIPWDMPVLCHCQPSCLKVSRTRRQSPGRLSWWK